MAKRKTKKTRSEIAKKGWVTRRRKAKARQKQLKAEISVLQADRSLREVLQELKDAQKERDLARGELKTIKEEAAEALEDKLGLQSELYSLYRDVDQFYEKRTTHFSEKQYQRLLEAETQGDYYHTAEDLAEEMDCQVSDIYDLWLSP